MTAREEMVKLFRELGGSMQVNGLFAKPAINKTGELFVNLYRGHTFYWSLSLDEFSTWAVDREATK